MKRILFKYFSYKWAALICFLVLLITSNILNAQTTILSEGFESGVPPTGWTIIDNNSDTYKWSQSSTAHSGSYSMYYPYNSSSAANDWAITNSLSLTAGVTYTISFWYKVYSSSYPESMKLTVGNAATVAAQSTILWTGATLTSTTWTQVTTTYTPSTSGTYYFGFYCYSAADMWNLYVDDILITSPASCTTPGAPTSVSGTATGQTTANLSWAAGTPAGSATVTYYWVVGTSSSVTYGSGVAQGTTTSTSATTSALSCGTTYYLRVYAYTSCDGTSSSYTTSSSFTTSACSGGPCASVTSMTAGTTYTGTLATTGSDWSTYTDCAYTESGDEVVYSFTPGSTGNYTFTGTATSGDPDFYLMSSCGNTGTNITGSCWDSGDRTVSLTAGTTYYLVVDNYSSSSSAGYSVVVNSTAAGPSNDDCDGAITLSVGASCSYSSYTNANATATTGVPAPGCANYLGGDVWFKATVPASGHIILDMDDNVMTDAGMAIYTGTCGSLTLVECDDDDSNNGLMSMIDRSGLSAGSTIYIRVWEYGNDNNGSFYICAYDPGIGACGSVTNIASCGTSTTVTSGGGSGNWNNQECGSGTPGVEKIFSFTPSTTAAYYLVITSASSYMTYAYQAGTCQSTGWTCMARPNAPGTYGPFNWTAGVTYYILVDDEDASSSTDVFYIKCPETAGTYYHPTQNLQNSYLGACMVNTCSGIYTDDGGASNYSEGIDCYRTFCPNSAGKCVRATFNSMSLNYYSSSYYDDIEIRNGPTQNSPILWWGTGTLASPITGSGTFSNPFTSTDQSGCLTFWFTSDNDGRVSSGWNITLSCVNCSASPTNNDCNTATPICGATNVNSASPGPGITSTCGGCNLSEDYSNWYYFEITNSGRLYLDIKPEDFFEDYDMALYQASNCASLGNPVRCTYAMTPQYCQPTSTGTSYYISRVRFNTIDNTSTYYSDFYANYTTSVSTTVTAGSAYNLQVTVVGATMYVVAWFDWNKNLQFDSGEFYSLGSGGNTTLSSSITIPGTARLGKTAFRVYTTRGGAVPNTDACVSYTNGEIEDYAIYISDGSHCSNGVKDADEIGVDCGGTGCVPCDASYWPTNTGMNSTSTDYSEDVMGDSWVQGIPVNAGESYYLMVNNWSPGANGFDLIWNFTEGGAMDCSIVVPVELIDFEAKLFGQFTTLYWETASETNNDYFTVMKSTDAIIYKPIGSVDGAGNSNSIHTYTFDDTEPITQTTYYRLKQTDFDGKTTYSEVKVVSPNVQSSVQQFNVYNDVNEENLNITLIGSPNAIVDYAIVDVMGRVVKQGKINIDENALGGMKLSTNDVAAGIYNIVISDGKFTAMKKFVIVK